MQFLYYAALPDIDGASPVQVCPDERVKCSRLPLHCSDSWVKPGGLHNAPAWAGKWFQCPTCVLQKSGTCGNLRSCQQAHESRYCDRQYQLQVKLQLYKRHWPHTLNTKRWAQRHPTAMTAKAFQSGHTAHCIHNDQLSSAFPTCQHDRRLS